MLAVNLFAQPELVADICGVSLRQARRYRASGVAPPPVVRLMRAYYDGRLLPNTKDWQRWRIVGDRLISTDMRDVSFLPNELRCWWFERQELSRFRLRDKHCKVQYLMDL